MLNPRGAAKRHRGAVGVGRGPEAVASQSSGQVGALAQSAGSIVGRVAALPAVWLRYDAHSRHQGRQALSLLRLLQRFEARLGSLPFSVRPRRWDGGDRHGAGLEGEPGF